MRNDTAGLFGGLLLGAVILGTAVWLSPSARAWAVSALGGTPAGSNSSSSVPNYSGPAMGSSSFGTYSSLPAASTQPYQLTLGPNGVQIQTAAELPANESGEISLPTIAQLAPTTPSLAYA